MPGATLETVNGDEFTGSVKVKLGPVAMTYGGEAKFVSKDESTHTAVIEGKGKESRGSGTASAHVTAKLVEEGPTATRVDVSTELTITGKAAQFGRGVMQDVAGRIVGQFAENLGATMAAANVAASEETSAPAPAPVQAADSIDLLGTAGAPVLKRAIPVIVVVAVVVGAVVWWIVKK